ncbi:MAG TPA: PAN domain-containing protein, partial [Xanthobacteraceae bacterium]|nr:PAN domain-containing protein [Xanthobacteraceae bacterium]
MRTLVIGFAVLVGAAAATAAGIVPALSQSGYDRPGGDYVSDPVVGGDPAVCAARCEHDKNCRAWSFAYPTAAGGAAVCRLKREVVPRVRASCCVSGVRGAGVIEPKLGELEYSIDRVGGDYRSFETPPDAKA